MIFIAKSYEKVDIKCYDIKFQNRMLKVAGCNSHKQLNTNPNENANSNIFDINLDVKSLLSVSFYEDHSIWITKDGKAHAIGSNDGGRIYCKLNQGILENITDYQLSDNLHQLRNLLSAVCGLHYTLYMLQASTTGGVPLIAYVRYNHNQGQPIFINLHDRIPIALYGGKDHSAIIDKDGNVHIITESIFDSEDRTPEMVSLPNKEKSVSVACCDHDFLFLSKNGNAYKCAIINGKLSDVTEVSEFHNIKISNISGTCRHAFAVTNDGSVYARGQNGYGELGLGRDVENANHFKLVTSLNQYRIANAFAGYSHSLFLTVEGKLLACGYNGYGQLFFDSPNYKDTYSIEETCLNKDVTFCIAGHALSAAFIGCKPPPRCPNQKIIDDFTFDPFSYPSNQGYDIDYLIQRVVDAEKQRDEQIAKNNKLLRKIDAVSKENKNLQKQLDALTSIQDDLELKLKKSCNIPNAADETDLESESQNWESLLQVMPVSAISQLRKVKTLGHGETSKAIKVSRDEFLVLKIFDPKIFLNSDNSDPELYNMTKMKHYFDDYVLLSKLNHINIVQFLGFSYGDNNHPPFLLSEYYPYTLKGIIKKLSDVERIRIILEIIQAMISVHQIGIIHRNLKPENVMLTASKQVKIGDFGIDKLLSIKEIIQSKKLNDDSIKFLAPELLQHRKYDNKVDIFAFGTTLFFILTRGEYPKSAGTKGSNFLDSLNTLSKQIIQSCWNESADHRPPFKQILEMIVQGNFMVIDGIESEIPLIRSFHLS